MPSRSRRAAQHKAVGPPQVRGRGSSVTNEPGRPQGRRMDLVASVSRSSGLEKDGDTLKDNKVQEEYREFINGKMDDVLQKYHRRVVESDAERMHRVEAQENVLILFRKLREGISSARRQDQFALEVYETSLFLAIIFESPRHASVIIPHLVPDLYLPCSEHSQHVTFTILASSVHHLLAQYPSQGLFHQHLDSIPHQLFPKDSKARKWLTSLASCLRKRQYAMFERESRRSTILRVLCLQEEELGLSKHLGSLAVLVAVDSLRAKARETAWTVMRSAYRELACHVGSMDTRNWLERSLCLKSTISESFTIPLEQFLDQQSSLGAVRAKEGVEGRWIVCKIRS